MLGGGGFLGPYDRILATEDTQHMWWDPALQDIQLTEPLCISDTERAEHHHDMCTGKTKPCKFNKNGLIYCLHSSVVVAKGHKADIFF